MYKPTTAFILNTNKSDKKLMEIINTFAENWKDNWKLYIIDECKVSEDSEEKTIFYEIACSQYHSKVEQRIDVYRTTKILKDNTMEECHKNIEKMGIKYIIPLELFDKKTIIDLITNWS